MQLRSFALPRPERVHAAAALAGAAREGHEVALNSMMRRRDALSYELGLVRAEIEQFHILSLCGAQDEGQDVESYDGSLGVTRAFVDAHEKPIGQLQWLDDLPQRFNGAGELPGLVSGVRFGSGALFQDDLFLTAGHCFDPVAGGFQAPSRNGIFIGPGEIAKVMQVNFDFQNAGSPPHALRPGQSFPIVELVENGLERGHVDYAIVRLGRNAAGQLPGEVFGTLTAAARDLRKAGATLCIIQHPSGGPKKIEAGPMLVNKGGRIRYTDLDTNNASSGAAILSSAGEIVGVHTNGGCHLSGGSNFGQAIGAIRAASDII